MRRTLTNTERRAGLSRRDFMLGRFLRNRTGRSLKGSELTRKSWRPLVMRYPKSLTEVAANDEPPEPTISTQPVEISAKAARRRTIPVHRPPGAIDEESFLSGCTRCEECIKACPHDAIVHAPANLREAAGTPIIQADHQPCLMCEDFPCIAACEPNVLTLQVPPMMGTARVTEHLCLPYHGTTCTVCSERCPVDGAIEVSEGKPTVNEGSCTGCGVCRYVCPAPENAILLMPTFIRPTPLEPTPS